MSYNDKNIHNFNFWLSHKVSNFHLFCLLAKIKFSIPFVKTRLENSQSESYMYVYRIIWFNQLSWHCKIATVKISTEQIAKGYRPKCPRVWRLAFKMTFQFLEWDLLDSHRKILEMHTKFKTWKKFMLCLQIAVFISYECITYVSSSRWLISRTFLNGKSPSRRLTVKGSVGWTLTYIWLT